MSSDIMRRQKTEKSTKRPFKRNIVAKAEKKLSGFTTCGNRCAVCVCCDRGKCLNLGQAISYTQIKLDKKKGIQ